MAGLNVTHKESPVVQVEKLLLLGLETLLGEMAEENGKWG